MFLRSFSVTVRGEDSSPVVGAVVAVNERTAVTASNGRARVEGVSSDWHQVQLTIKAAGFEQWSNSIAMDGDPLKLPIGNIDWPDVYLSPANVSIRVEGDQFMSGSSRWTWKGSTDFRLIETVLSGGPAAAIIQDRKAAGANLLRVLSMKANNTGWELLPYGVEYWDALKETLDLCGDLGMKVELTVFADTKRNMSSQGDQFNHWRACCDVAREYNCFVELVNEDKHPTQQLDSAAFQRPSGILASHGSGLSDVQPVKPLWNYATYHARRFPNPPNAKPFNNINPYEFHPEWPHPVPYVCEESVKPENYGHNPRYAAQMGLAAALGPGATFHHSAWNEGRLFNNAERACAEAFYGAL